MAFLNHPSDGNPTSGAPHEPEPGTLASSREVPGAAEKVSLDDSSRAPTRVKGAVREFLETVALALIIFLAVRTFVMNYRVVGHSMQPTIEEGQFLLIDKLLYKLSGRHRGDIIVLNPPDMPGQIYVKRIIALPGETVTVANGRVLINGQELPEPWAIRPSPLSNWGPAQVGQGELFVMGDNRPGSRDSRYFGMLPVGNVIGRAFLCYWPPSKWTTYPRVDQTDLIAAP